MPIVFIGLIVVVGLIVGSLVAAVIDAILHDKPIGDSIKKCSHCEFPLRGGDLIPIYSWLRLRGRCPGCGLVLNVLYPLVEASTAGLFGLVAWRIGWSPLLIVCLYLVAVGVALSVIDFYVHQLPDVLTLPSYVVCAILLAGASYFSDDWQAFVRAAVAMLVLFVAYYLLALLVVGGLGFGDVKLAGVLGLALGWHSWTAVIIGTILAFIYGSLFSLVLLLTRRAKPASHVAFGPFMFAGALTVLLMDKGTITETLPSVFG